jgi:hypothetical protein
MSNLWRAIGLTQSRHRQTSCLVRSRRNDWSSLCRPHGPVLLLDDCAPICIAASLITALICGFACTFLSLPLSLSLSLSLSRSLVYYPLPSILATSRRNRSPVLPSSPTCMGSQHATPPSLGLTCTNRIYKTLVSQQARPPGSQAAHLSPH